MPYSAVDPVIKVWVAAHQFGLLTEFGGEAARFFYVTGGPQECFQISIAPPSGEQVLVYAGSVETIDDAELRETWVVPVEELASALDRALDRIGAWRDRPKGPATWQPPASWGSSA